MATFQFQSHPFIIDPMFLPNTPTKMSGFMDESNINNNPNFHSQFYQPQPMNESLVCSMFHESSSVESVDHSSKAVLSDNEHSYVTKKQSTDDNSTVVDDKLESGEQVTQKKRTRNLTTFNSSQFKGARQGKSKKQKKYCNNDGLKNEKKEQKKACDEPPTGYIHVRARRGEATDSHSLAERVRREKISERMKTLQCLVPGCDKVTGKALMLDEIINYVQSLQNQVEFLSMKLASLNPMYYYDFGVDLETMMIRQEERVNNITETPQLPIAPPGPLQQCNNPIQTTVTPSHNYPLLDVSTALFLQQAQRPNVFSHPQDNGSLLWEVEGQRQKDFNSSQLNHNLRYFH